MFRINFNKEKNKEEIKGETNVKKAMRTMMSRDTKSNLVPPQADFKNNINLNKGSSKSNSVNNSPNFEYNEEEEVTADLPNILRLLKQQLLLFIEEKSNSKLKKSDFERVRSFTYPNKSFENVTNSEEDNEDSYNSEGRKSYLRIKNRKNWPPTMEDLLEYINIYSQMNNIKFTFLNYEEFYEKKNNKRKKKKDKTKFHKKWESISKIEKSNSIPKKERKTEGRKFSAVI